MNPPVLAYETSEPPLLSSRVAVDGCGDETRTHIISLTRRVALCIQLSYTAIKSFGGPGGTQTLKRSLQDFYVFSYITGPQVCHELVAVGGLEPPISRL